MKIDVLALPAFAENGNLRGIIEIPAGTNHKFEFNKQKLEFENDLRDGKPRVIDFLPYPVNYGFIPNTKMDKERGGDGDPLDILLIAESVPTGTVIEVKPIGLLLLQDGGEWDNKVLAIPIDESKRIIKATNFKDFQQNYSMIRHILEMYFQYYDGLGVMKIMGWEDEKAAVKEVKKWLIK
jgi:inorganic pyrophosphatase